MEDTSGFYKWDDYYKEWTVGRVIIFRDFQLNFELKDTYEYPVEGWSWYDERPEDKK